MERLPGVYSAQKKDGEIYFRSSITFNRKHISLGSFPSADLAHQAYVEASAILSSDSVTIPDYSETSILSFDKWVCLINFRDNRVYFKNPIYLRSNYFYYYLSLYEELKFDIDDLFFYSSHKIMRRKGHLFVSDYGMQLSIASRYGIKNYSVNEIDYRFINGDYLDYRYENIEIINRYYGVRKIKKNGKDLYKVKIHISGDYVVGLYEDETEAAIAYNKAVDMLSRTSYEKNYPQNYIENLSGSAYASLYTKIKISDKIKKLSSK